MSLRAAIDRIHRTRVPAPGGVILSNRDYATMYSLAVRGQALISPGENVSELPKVDGLAIAELGVFELPECETASGEFRAWLNNGQRLVFAIPKAMRRVWVDRLLRLYRDEDRP